jgi:acyl-CoA thioesterase FadM
VDCHIDELREKSFRIFHRIRRGNQVIALVETGIVAYDYRFGHVVQLPDKFLAGLQN